MFEYLQCPAHLLPRDIVTKDNQLSMALCSQCFIGGQTESKHPKGIRLNSRTLQLFTTFTTYIENKMRQWANSAKKGGIDTVFQRVINGHCIALDAQSGQKLNEIVVEVINHYKNLMRSNRQYVNANLNPDVLYHPQFLKDIYNMVLEGWETSSLVIESNFKQKILQTLPQKLNLQYNIKPHLVNEINREKQRIVNQFAEDILVPKQTNQKEVKFSENRLGMFGHGCSEPKLGAATNKFESMDELEQGIFDIPLVIKKVDSFLEIKEQLQSNKQIEGNGVLRRNKMKNSKLIDEDDYYCWKAKFLGNLHQIETLKNQNERLLSENTLLANQKSSLQEDNQILRKKYEKLLHDSKQRLTSGKKQNQNVDPNSELLLNIVELEVEVNDSRHDINILAGCLNQLIKSSAVSRESIAKKLKVLRTIHIHN